MASAWTPLANITLGANQISVTFSSISGSYRDLFVSVVTTSATGNAGINMRFNGDTGANYSSIYMTGNGSTAASGTYSGTFAILNANVVATTTSVTNLGISILDYSATDKHKSSLVRTNNATNGVDALANRWANTAAITSVVILTDGNPFAAGSTFALYGVAA